MDRVLVYPGQIPLETDLLNTNKNMMVALAKVQSLLLGSNTVINGFVTAPTSPASLQVSVGAGEIYANATIDGTSYSSLAADTAHTIMKQGISLDPVLLNCPAPVVAGQSINYLIQVAYSDTDAGATVLPYYNSANPSQAYSGPNNTGQAQATQRKGAVAIVAKAGASATTGTQTAPAPDAGFVGAYVVTVAYGQTAITASNISQYASAPAFSGFAQLSGAAFAGAVSIPLATAAAHAVQFGQVSGVAGQTRNLMMTLAAASASATLVADEIVVETSLGGLRYCLPGFSKTINLATTGAGGMDTGTAPVSGYVAIYAIYNPANGASALLAVNATSTKAPTIYGGANMPAGYTASALVSVWPTNGSGQFVRATQRDRKIAFGSIQVLSSATNSASPTAFSLAAAVPPNAVLVSGNLQVGSSSAGSLSLQITSDGAIDAQQVTTSSTAVVGAFRDAMLTTQQQLFYFGNAASGTPSFVIGVTNYTF